MSGDNMQVGNVNGLIGDVKVAFVLPIVAFVVFTVVTKFTPHSKVNALMQRLSLVFVLLLFMFLLSALMFQDRGELVAIWRSSPIAYTFVYAICSLIVVAIIACLTHWKLRPELWSRKQVGKL